MTDKNCVRSAKDEIITLECLVMLNYQLEIVQGDESVTSIHHYDEVLCEFTIRPLYLSTDMHTYG